MNSWALIIIVISNSTIDSGYELRQRFNSESACLKMAEIVKHNSDRRDFTTLCLPVLPQGEFEPPNKGE